MERGGSIYDEFCLMPSWELHVSICGFTPKTFGGYSLLESSEIPRLKLRPSLKQKNQHIAGFRV